jgi:hypothetical protein
VRQRHAVQRRQPCATAAQLVGVLRRFQRTGAVEPHHGIQLAADGFEPPQRHGGRSDRRDLAGGNGIGKRAEVKSRYGIFHQVRSAAASQP